MIFTKEAMYGGLPVYFSEVEDFKHYIDTYALYDLGFKGILYTWWNGGTNDTCIFKRLDIYLANQQFQDILIALEMDHLIQYGSDNASLVLS